jgi:hypothetical protein
MLHNIGNREKRNENDEHGFSLYNKPIRQYRPLLHHHHPILDRIQRMVRIFQVVGAIDPYIIPDTAVLIYNGIADIASFTDAEPWQPALQGMVHFLDGLEVIGPHKAAIHDGGTMAHAAPDTDHTGLDAAGIDNAALGNDGPFQRGAADFGRRQHAGAGINGA